MKFSSNHFLDFKACQVYKILRAFYFFRICFLMLLFSVFTYAARAQNLSPNYQLKKQSKKILSLSARGSFYWNFLDIPDTVQLSVQSRKYLRSVYRGGQADLQLEFYLNPQLTIGAHYQRYSSDVQEVFNRTDTLSDKVVHHFYGVSVDYFLNLGRDWEMGLGGSVGATDYSHFSSYNRLSDTLTGQNAGLVIRVMGNYRVYENWQLTAGIALTSSWIVNPTIRGSSGNGTLQGLLNAGNFAVGVGLRYTLSVKSKKPTETPLKKIEEKEIRRFE